MSADCPRDISEAACGAMISGAVANQTAWIREAQGDGARIITYLWSELLSLFKSGHLVVPDGVKVRYRDTSWPGLRSSPDRRLLRVAGGLHGRGQRAHRRAGRHPPGGWAVLPHGDAGRRQQPIDRDDLASFNLRAALGAGGERLVVVLHRHQHIRHAAGAALDRGRSQVRLGPVGVRRAGAREQRLERHTAGVPDGVVHGAVWRRRRCGCGGPVR